jgi:hypothetical protein
MDELTNGELLSPCAGGFINVIIFGIFPAIFLFFFLQLLKTSLVRQLCCYGNAFSTLGNQVKKGCIPGMEPQKSKTLRGTQKEHVWEVLRDTPSPLCIAI